MQKWSSYLECFVGMLLLLISTVACQKTSLNDQNNQAQASQINTRLGLAYLDNGQTVRAKHKLLVALQQDPQSAEVFSSLGYFSEKTGSMKEAAIYYQKSLRLAPRQGEILNNYGAYLCRQKHYLEAERLFLAAITDPNYIHRGEAYENAGLCVMQIPILGRARYYFELALRQDPQRTTAREELIKLGK